MVRPDPESLLRRIQAEEVYENTGRLKVFLGYASGVGKSFRMLDEGRRRRDRGQDVIVGAVQPVASEDLDNLLRQMEVIPFIMRSGIAVMDVDRILRRRPQVCLVDGLAYDNPAGSRNAHRWQDVDQLLRAGISVLATVNLQFVEERRRQVEQIRGKSVDVTVPESFLRKADEIVIVDAPAEFCVDRMADTPTGAESPDRQQKLSQLREIALLLAADVVDKQLEAYLARRGVEQVWGTQERILVCLTPRTNAVRMIERAKRVASRFHGEMFVIYIKGETLTADEQAALDRNLAVASNAGIDVKLLEGDDPVTTIIEYARRQGITQIFIGHSVTSNWLARFTQTTVDRLIRSAEGIDVKLFPH